MDKKQHIILSENHKLFYRVYGQGQYTVILLHGLVGGSWLDDDWIHSIVQNNIRCIVPERPGYGTSSPIFLQNVSEWIPLIQALAKELQITSADVIGCSAGAPYAYATGLALPQIIKKVYILDGVPAVYEEHILRHYSDEDRKAYQNFLHHPIEEIQKDYIQQMEEASQRMEHTNFLYIKNTLQEVLSQQCFGMAQESRLQILPWNLPFSQIKQTVILYHAPSDEMVPYAAAKEMLPYFIHSEFHKIEMLHLPPAQSPHMGAISQSFLQIMNSIGISNN